MNGLDIARRLDPAARRGFTLIELLIVISILGVLAAVLLPQILGADKSAKEQATNGSMLQLETGAKTFERAHGYYPPDDLKSPEAGAVATWKADNGRNTGIESLVCFLSQGMKDGQDLSGNADRLTNTDDDKHGADLPLLHRSDRPEYADAWNTPLAYFGKFGMDRPQVVLVDPDSEPATVRSKRRADGTLVGGKFQLLSAGPDRTFGTDDDLCWPDN